MKKIGLVFPGQGSQFVGMCRELYDQYEDVRAFFGIADETLGFSISNLCFQGPEEELRQTYNTQPALLLASYSVWRVLKKELSVEPFLLAGHSLGEYTALLASGFFTFEDALRITRMRGMLMEKACPKGKGGMVALLGPNMEVVRPLLEEISYDDYVAVPANLNSAEQVVLSGDMDALREGVDRLKGMGYKKAIFLNVSGPFHSPLMREAADALKAELEGIHSGDMRVAVVSNVDATPTMDKNLVVGKLYGQMCSAVQWEASVKRMAAEGVELFLEVGPQKVLTNLIRKITPDVPCHNVEKITDIETLRGVL
jgi:[acyl-carrier-protein] S-malonyltransferase